MEATTRSISNPAFARRMGFACVALAAAVWLAAAAGLR